MYGQTELVFPQAFGNAQGTMPTGTNSVAIYSASILVSLASLFKHTWEKALGKEASSLWFAVLELHSPRSDGPTGGFSHLLRMERWPILCEQREKPCG